MDVWRQAALVRRMKVEAVDELVGVGSLPDPSAEDTVIPVDKPLRLPVKRWVREALNSIVMRQVLIPEEWATDFVNASGSRAAKAVVSRATSRQPRGVSDDELRQVAEVYRTHMGAGQKPVKAVARHLRTPFGSDIPWRRVAEARRRGLLGPAAGRGRKGER